MDLIGTRWSEGEALFFNLLKEVFQSLGKKSKISVFPVSMECRLYC